MVVYLLQWELQTLVSVSLRVEAPASLEQLAVELESGWELVVQVVTEQEVVAKLVPSLAPLCSQRVSVLAQELVKEWGTREQPIESQQQVS
jgi:hypothetical protein